MTLLTAAPRSPETAPSEPALWLRRWVAASVMLLAVVTVLSAFADDMPASHRILVPIAVPVIVAAWAMELTEQRWSRLVLIAAVVGANVWMTLIGHLSANYLFLILLVAWVGVVGSRVERTAALALSLATVLLAIVVDAGDGQVAWGSWMSWLAGLVIIWLMALVLGRQERLVAELRESRADAEQRSHELSTLLTVSRSVASTLEMTPLLDTVLDALNAVVEYSGTAILTLDESGEHLVFAHMRGPSSFAWAAAREIRYPVAEFEPVWGRLGQEEPVFVGDIRAPGVEAATFRKLVGSDELDTTYALIRSVMWVPLLVRGRVIGILSVANSTPDAFGQHEATLALGIARQAAVAIENARLHERARHAAALEERERLARELHDSVTQSLYGISLYAEAAARALADGEPEPAAESVRELQDISREALGEMRLLLYELRPPLLEEQGLAAALRTRLQAVEARAGLSTTFESHGDRRLPLDAEQELFRVAHEALNNVLKHAHARHVEVRLDVSDTCARLEIHDDGVGFEPTLRGGGGYGLPGMRERVARLDGNIEIESANGSGTRVAVEVPR